MDKPPVIVLGDDVDEVVERAAEVLRGGGVIVLPTDTVYGLAALPGDSSATERLFELKGRGSDAPLAVLCADVEQAAALAEPSIRRRLRAVGERWWPGPLTMVVPRATGIALSLGEPATTIGLRVPDHGLVHALATAVGPIAATSANRHGEATPTEAAEAAASLTGQVDLVLDGGRLDGSASTVIEATSSPWRVLRDGPVPAEEILSASDHV